MQLKQHLTYLVAIFFLTIVFFLYMSYREINSSIDYEVGTIQSKKVIDSIYIVRDNKVIFFGKQEYKFEKFLLHG